MHIPQALSLDQNIVTLCLTDPDKKTSDSVRIENKIPTHRDLRAPQLCNQRRHSNHVDPPSLVRIRFKIVMAAMTDEKGQCCVSSIFHCNS